MRCRKSPRGDGRVRPAAAGRRPAGGMVRAGTPWRDVLEALRNHELEFLEDRHAASEQHVNLWRMIEVSVGALTTTSRQRLAELAVFPEDETIPEAAVTTLWPHTGGLNPRQSRKADGCLKQRSLVNLAELPGGRGVGDAVAARSAPRLLLALAQHDLATIARCTQLLLTPTAGAARTAGGPARTTAISSPPAYHLAPGGARAVS